VLISDQVWESSVVHGFYGGKFLLVGRTLVALLSSVLATWLCNVRVVAAGLGGNWDHTVSYMGHEILTFRPDGR